ncbi:MAG: hypothetical protein KJZ69_09330 [Phycisphaerales bacterium]|nr:hypothetical protein [Phycisphaerales bacterium]
MYLREDDPDGLMAGERLDEIAGILAGGVVAMHRRGATMATDSGAADSTSTCLDPRPCSDTHRPTGLRGREPQEGGDEWD